MRTDFLQQLQQQHEGNRPFCLATVIKVDGSASARTGSKAIFDFSGRNISGWVGGGCAERFVGEQALEAILDKRPRTVIADLDDEIFGLGVACGGKMEVFIEPVFPNETLRIPKLKILRQKSEQLAKILGLKIQTDTSQILPNETIENLLLTFAQSLAQVRGRSLAPLRSNPTLPLSFKTTENFPFSSLTILGKGRIVETLAKLTELLGWSSTVIAPGLNAKDYPAKVRCQCLLESYDEIYFEKNSAVLIASHHAKDPEFVQLALNAGASYVGMIGSHKRAREVFDHLSLQTESSLPLFVPAGLDLEAQTPEEIALSVIAELLHCGRHQ